MIALSVERRWGKSTGRHEMRVGKIGEALRRSDPSGGPVCEPNRILAQAPIFSPLSRIPRPQSVALLAESSYYSGSAERGELPPTTFLSAKEQP